MSYKPLLLALMLCFSAPAFAAPAAQKEKAAAAKKTAAAKKETTKAAPKAAAKKETGKKEAAKDKTASKKDSTKDKAADKKNTRAAEKSAAKSTAKADAKKSDGKTASAAKTRTDKAEAAANAKNAKNTVRSKGDDKKAAASSSAKPPEKAAAKPAARKAADSRSADAKSKAKTANAKTKEPAKADKQTAAKSGSASGDTPELRAAVSAATNDLEAKQALQKRTASFLVRVNGNLKEIQQARSNLSNINRQQRDAWDKLQKLSQDLNKLQTEVANTRAQISRFVSGNYKNSQPNAVALFLKNAEPGQKTRFLRYTRYINSANEKVVKDLAKQQQDLSAQEKRIGRELAHLKRLQANAQAALKKQGARNTAEQVAGRRQNNKMAQEAQKAVKQKDNEQRLNTLLSDLDKQKAEQRKKEAEARKKAAEARLAAAEKARRAKAAEAAAQKKAEQERAALSNLTEDDMKLQAPNASSAASLSNPNSFSRMQGRLSKPVNGMLTGLFGQPRADGGLWKGVFYQSVPAAVHSIAAGSVTFAGDLDGYGKVVIIDHGDNYVSVYSGLSDTAVAKGYSVGAGHNIGTSGKLPEGEEGLYLEIRYKGQNMNPLSWIN
ncbi:peptidoglycan DD-metalloendopeptidase family protein [Bergeriella denitrificans]|uniref:Putative metallopeptidase n=1 Tax=Bergeriella denitrificans TaxID=494 RepID=A0A378UIF5_BERDE|nr:peptidoglycan DD-metalloendopeptidase family protein [Bergeriella denitrificans]STZ76262.1 putative metallopeptidase [Bergeriella denitrificans]